MEMFITAIYIGGMFALEGEKIGFWNRVFWPMNLGEMLAAWAWGCKK